MQYLTGKHALNLNCDLITCGDWHQSALRWVDLTIRESSDSIFGEWGIEFDKKIPEHTELFSTANHIRALLDLIAEGNFAVAQGMRDDFICNDAYTPLVFKKVSMLKGMPHWDKIDAFMSREYKMQWVNYKKETGSWENGKIHTDKQ